MLPRIPTSSRTAKVVVATTVMLSFISFWRASAIVLCDLASSAYYAGGIAEGFIGKSAPWFILSIMLFSYAVRAVYIESCSMFVRGGVYRVVHEAMGPTLAKFSVSALLFDYILTGPISGVSAGLYLAGLLNTLAAHSRWASWQVNPEYFAMFFAIATTAYFWRKNIIGLRESSGKAMRIMQLTTVMVVMLIVWCVATMLTRGFQTVPLPSAANLHMTKDALGWLWGTPFAQITAVLILVGLGHSILAMSGEETLAQINREIASPKLQNLKRTGLVIFAYSFLFTSLVSFFAVMLIPDGERPKYLDNLISGLALHLVGPAPVRLLFQGFVVLVGTVILAGAVNTAIVGSNGVLNRIAEDGVLPNWFRRPHSKFGTTHRFLTLIAGLQVVTLLISRGDVTLLGHAYAFGVIWSFAMKALSVLVLRFKNPEGREWKVPLNFRIGRTEIPFGLSAITAALFTLAIVNLLTKQIATIAGLAFTAIFFTVLTVSEHVNRKRSVKRAGELEEFRLEPAADPSEVRESVRPGNVLVAVRNPHQLDHLARVLEKTDPRRLDVVVVTMKFTAQPGFGEHDLAVDEIFSHDVEELFSRVVAIAEKAGKPVHLLVVTGRDAERTLVETANRLGSSLVVMGRSRKISAAEQAKRFGDAWEELVQPRPQLSLQIYDPDRQEAVFFNLGPHPPRLWPEDLDLLHRLWLELSSRGAGPKLHHRDVVRVALRRLEQDLYSSRGGEVVQQVEQEAGAEPKTAA